MKDNGLIDFTYEARSARWQSELLPDLAGLPAFAVHARWSRSTCTTSLSESKAGHENTRVCKWDGAMASATGLPSPVLQACV